MKLLLDENLSYRLIPFLVHDFPGSVHVTGLGMESATDTEIWRYAKEFGFVIVTRDADFEELALVWGQPPQVIWLKTGNLSRAATLKALLDSQNAIEQALIHQGQVCVEIA
jgi:predicted nuclease of predicted toxin-antitoxin system